MVKKKGAHSTGYMLCSDRQIETEPSPSLYPVRSHFLSSISTISRFQCSTRLNQEITKARK